MLGKKIMWIWLFNEKLSNTYTYLICCVWEAHASTKKEVLSRQFLLTRHHNLTEKKYLPAHVAENHHLRETNQQSCKHIREELLGHHYLWHLFRTAPRPSCHVNNSAPSWGHVNNSSTCRRSVSLQTKEHEKVIHGVSSAVGGWALVTDVMTYACIPLWCVWKVKMFVWLSQTDREVFARWEQDEASEEDLWAVAWWASRVRE